MVVGDVVARRLSVELSQLTAETLGSQAGRNRTVKTTQREREREKSGNNNGGHLVDILIIFLY